jgi:transcription elongation factor Elf1
MHKNMAKQVAVCPVCVSPYELEFRLTLDAKNTVHVVARPMNCPACEHQLVFDTKSVATRAMRTIGVGRR